MRIKGRHWNASILGRAVATGLLSVSTLTVGLYGGAAVSAAGHPARTYAFSDSHVVPPQSQLLQQLQVDAATCPTTKKPVQMSLSRAVTRADDFLKQKVGQKGLNAFRSDPASHSLGGDGALAFSAIGAHSPGLALAALLAAHEKAPTDPRYLINASSVLTGVGLPDEALAFDRAALALKPSGATPLGVGDRALALNNEGYALDAMGQFGAAQTALTSALTLSPYLIEADNNLAEALNCSGKRDKAVRYMAAGMRRDNFRGDDLPPGRDPLLPHQFGAPEILDLSAGKTTTYPDVKLPDTAEKAMALYETYQQDAQQGYAEGTAIGQRESRLYQSLPRNLNPLTEQRLNDLEWAVITSTYDPSIKPLVNQFDKLNNEVAKLTTDYWNGTVVVNSQKMQKPGEFAAWCQQATPPKHKQWLGIADQLETVTDKLGKAYSKYGTGIAANVKNPTWHEYLLALVDSYLNGAYYSGLLGTGVLDWVQNMHSWKTICVPGSAQPPPDSDFTDPTYEKSPACPEWLQSINIRVKVLSFLTVELRCESIKVEASTGGVIGLFGSVEFNTRTKKTTVMVGPKIGGELGNVAVGAKGGFYITVDSHGKVTDFGEKYSASYTAKGEIYSTKVIETSATLSFAGAFSP
jgi:tetratricopeptide (TPR) repeat protein